MFMAKKKSYDDDDGRTIIDMSGVERTPLVIPRLPKKEKAKPETQEKPAWEKDELNKDQRRALIGGSLGAALLVVALFALAIAGVILLITFVGR